MKSYLISALVVRFEAQGREVFLRQHPHDWLVWEAGAWKPPTSKTVAVSRDSLHRAANQGAESLAIALEPRADGLVLGRAAAQADLVINDGRLSGHHLTFRRLPDTRWTVEDAHSKNGTRLDGDVLTPGAPVVLHDGVHIDAANVALTYYTVDGMLRRLSNTSTP